MSLSDTPPRTDGALSPEVPVPTDTPVLTDAPAADAPGAPGADAPRADAPSPDVPRPRTGTIVWGLVLALLGAAIAAIGFGATLDVEAVLIAMLLIAGTSLLVGALVAARRRR